MLFPNKTKRGMSNFRSAGVSPAFSEAGETPALRRVGRATAWVIVLTLAFAWSGQALADNFDWQQPGNKPAPKTLDQALAAAMQGNPEIAMAKAKLALAEAELSGARFETARRVVALWGDFQNQKELLEMARQDFDGIMKLRQAGSANTGDIDRSRKSLIEVQAKVSRTQSELDYLIGRGVSETVSGGGSSANTATLHVVTAPLQLPRGPYVEQIRKALLAPTKISFIEAPLSDVVDYLKDFH